MSEESGLERTEPPSDRKLEKAREDGHVPRSKELTTFLGLIAAGVGLWVTGSTAVDQVKKLLTGALAFDRARAYDMLAIGSTTWTLLTDIFIAFLPVALVLMVVAVASPIFIGGWNMSAKAITPDFNRMNPAKGLGNLISKRALVELIKAIAKATLVGLVSYIIIKNEIPELLGLALESASVSVHHFSSILWHSFIWITASLGLIALIDAPYQVKTYMDGLKMTREEVKQESRESEGDPQIKAKIRQQQREMAKRRMMSEVPNADVVVVNPTHYSVALKYASDGNTAPIVVAKGKDEVAAKIKEVAKENGVPILSAPPLARALHKHSELGDEIPQALYSAVAQVLAYVFQLKTYNQKGGQRPLEPAGLEVPPGMDPNNTDTVD